MAQIFISHSANDKDLVNFFSRAGAATKVKLVFEEIEKLASGEVTGAKIQKDIQGSNAVFIVLGPGVHGTSHTRDWVVWESGVASNKEIWVFEPFSSLGQISVVIPRLLNYVVLNMNDSFLEFVRQVIHSYDDSHVLPTALATGGLGAAGGPIGAGIGFVAGLFLSSQQNPRPTGVHLRCAKCPASFHFHFPDGLTAFRCPVCNAALTLPF
jgi:hypothetical protein